MKSIGWTLANAALCGALALAAIGSAAAPSTAQAQIGNRPRLWCFVSPNDLPGDPNFGRCASFYPGASSYRADFDVRNLPAGSYTYVWTSELAGVLPCTTQSCTRTYRGSAPVSDLVTVTYTNTATGASATLGANVQINGPI
ncbi:hypothetical protein J5226_18580 [Lysobacter sp. K5869]|uniref:hypothetical protein n=1 Tax=Lysobacter sp. K5869 TaxID=2820808 RepID=UPI001C061326|nr:hypothetical protein [Lysobacter sp. K5869]QWP75600.1 hypothetical protein J5226_18580 [Lysobacter sp. K5869]